MHRYTIYQGWPDLFSDGPNFNKILFCGPQKNFLPYFLLYKDIIIDVNFRYFIHKCVINSLVVHPKFDTGAAKNLWRAACGPRAALWPPLLYNVLTFSQGPLRFIPKNAKTKTVLHRSHLFAANFWNFNFRSPISKTSVSSVVRVTNLPFSLTWEEIKVIFEEQVSSFYKNHTECVMDLGKLNLLMVVPF